MKNLSKVTFQNSKNSLLIRVAATEHPNQRAIFELCFDKGFKKSSPFI